MAFKLKGFSGFKNKEEKGGYHEGQVGDRIKEEMNDNIYTGAGPVKPKNMMNSKLKSTKVGFNRDSDENVKTVPLTANDYIDKVKNDRKDPDHKKSKKINKKLLG